MIGKLANTAGIVLAGGLSTRIGSDKGQLLIGSTRLAYLCVATLKTIFDQVVYVTNQPELAPVDDELTITTDEVPHLGPLGGIAAGLKISSATKAFVAAYDMPFIQPKLVRFLIDYDPEAQVTVPEISGRLEPLHAVYDRSCLRQIGRQLAAGKRKLTSFYDKVKVSVVPEAALRSIDPTLLSFFNINTREDLERARELVKTLGPGP